MKIGFVLPMGSFKIELASKDHEFYSIFHLFPFHLTWYLLVLASKVSRSILNQCHYAESCLEN